MQESVFRKPSNDIMLILYSLERNVISEYLGWARYQFAGGNHKKLKFWHNITGYISYKLNIIVCTVQIIHITAIFPGYWANTVWACNKTDVFTFSQCRSEEISALEIRFPGRNWNDDCRVRVSWSEKAVSAPTRSNTMWRLFLLRLSSHPTAAGTTAPRQVILKITVFKRTVTRDLQAENLIEKFTSDGLLSLPPTR
jgi:hypothetical protein